jgi:Peptidase S46
VKKLVLAFLLAAPLLAADGKWTPQQVLQLDPAWLKKQGLQIPPSRLWDNATGKGLLAATVNTGGCSGGFISNTGLFVTNHHCLFGVLQEHATPENDIITKGFLARTRLEELKSKTIRVTIPRRFTDVTEQVLAAIPKDADDLHRYRAIQKKRGEITAECEKQPSARCTVGVYDGGLQYILQETFEASDVRLVWAPPRAIGEYGGEVDNWMWPRHTGDFAIGRVYVDGKAYQPEFWFPLSTKGVAPDDFIMVLGYPGVTYRALNANEMAERILFFERRRDVYAEWIRLLDTSTKGNAAAEIAVADHMKTLANRQKNAEGQLAGMNRGRILEKQKAADRAVLSWAATNRKAALDAYDGMTRLADEKRRTFEHDFLLDHVRPTTGTIATGPKSLGLAVAIARNAMQKQKADADRDEVFAQRNQARLRSAVDRAQKSFHPAADKALLASFVRLASQLPADQRIAAIDQLPKDLDALYAASRLFELGERMKMFDETPEQLHARRDPLIEAGFALNQEIDAYVDRTDRWWGTISRHRPEWRRAVIGHAGKPIAPDGNTTLRVTFGHVKGYAPRDGLWATPQTTLAGALAKHTGEEPFDVPLKIREVAAASNPEKIPVNFLSDADTTSGNSGSPTLNGKGELVGVNFDRVWENVANDFGFNPDVARNINADVRYLLWVLDRVDRATELLGELGVK